MPYCEGCGSKLGEAESFCRHCGRKVARPAAVAQPPDAGARPIRPRLPVVVALVGALLVLAAVMVLSNLGRRPPAVYATETGIYALPPGSTHPERVADEDDAVWAAASPNGRWVAFVAADEDGSRLTLCTARGKVVKQVESGYALRDMQWASRGSSVLALRSRQDAGESRPGLELVCYDLAKESQPKLLVPRGDSPVAFRCSPDGRWVAYTSSSDGGGLWLIRLRGKGDPKRVAGDEVNEHRPPEWLSTDELLYGDDDGDLMTYSMRSGEHRALVDRDVMDQLRRSSQWIVALSRRNMAATVLGGSSREAEVTEMEMERGDDAHYFRMELRRATSYAVAARGDAVRLELVGQDGRILARGSEDAAANLVLATYTSDQNRSAYVQVRPSKGSPHARYAIWAVSDRREDREGDTSGPSRVLTKTGLVPRDNTFTFRGRGGGSVEINASSVEFDTVLSLYSGRSASGRVLARNDDSGGSRNSRISTRLPSTGWYSLRVDAYGNRFASRYASSGRFSLRVEGSGVLLNPTSQADAWPLVPQVGGLWGAAVPVAKLGSQPLPMRLLAPTAQGIQHAAAPAADACALVYGTGERSRLQLALLRAGRPPKVTVLDALPRGYPVRVVWDASGSSLLVALTQPSPGEPSGSELWLVPVNRPGQAKRIASGVQHLSLSVSDSWVQ